MIKNRKNIYIVFFIVVLNIAFYAWARLLNTMSLFSYIVTSGGLIYLSILLIGVWLCISLGAWRSVGFGLLGFPIYLFYAYQGIWWYLNFNRDKYGFLFFLVNPGTFGTLAGITGGIIDIMLANSRRKGKVTWWGLAGLIMVSGLCYCFTTALILAGGQ